MKRRWIFALGALLLCTLGAAPPPDTQAVDTLGIVPRPRSATLPGGTYTLPAHVRIAAGSPDERHVGSLAVDFLREHGIDATIVPVGAPAEIRLSQSLHDASIGSEGYHLTVGSDGITIAANAGAGLFYGLQSLEQIVPVHGAAVVPQANVADWPRYAWRGIHLDVSRHFFPISVVERYIDVAAHYKLNTFHWHLTDDQGWRIEIKRYPKLTTVSSCRAGTEEDSDATSIDGKRYCGYYTQSQIRAVVAYAKARYMTIVPEIEMPGHTIEVLKAYPQLGCTHGPFAVRETWGTSSDILCPTPQSIAFFKNVLAEVVQLFPGKYVHIGGDEVPYDAWQHSAFVHALMKREHLRTYPQVQSWFNRQIEAYLKSKNRRMVGWNEILKGGVTKSAIVMSWQGTQGGIAAAKQGNDVVMAPDGPLYFDAYQGDIEDEPEAFLWTKSTLKDVYDYNPTPAAFTPTQAKHILGAEGEVWSEYIPDTDDLFYKLLPRELALSEISWTPDNLKSWRSFVARTSNQYTWLDANGYNYRIPNPSFVLSNAGTLHFRNEAPTLRTVDADTDADSVTLTLTDPVAGSTLYYTTDGTTPTAHSTRYQQAFTLPLAPGASVDVTAICITPKGKASEPSEIRLTHPDAP